MTSPDLKSDEILRLVILDEDDLAVVSAHLQDARLSLKDATFLPRFNRFAVVASRVDWGALAQGQQRRRQSGFHFERVLRVQQSGFGGSAEAPLQLLAIAFRPTSAPAGEVLLTFAGGRMIRLEVECLEAEMRDLGEAWPVSDCTRHRLDEAGAGG